MRARGERGSLRVVLTDSGMGGLSICAGLENRLRSGGPRRPVELIYVNAWPDPGWGYNDLPDMASRAAVLDKALARMAGFGPDLIVIACNTLSILYEQTEFASHVLAPPPANGVRHPATGQILGDVIPCHHSGTGNHVPGPRPVPVLGIVDEGIKMFEEALAGDPGGRLILFGTKTTIESGEHIRRLVARGIAPERLAGIACHKLAAVIDDDPGSPDVAGMIEKCVPADHPLMKAGGPLFAGFVCTHYGYAREAFQSALDRMAGRRVGILDPNDRLAGSVAASVAADVGPDAEAGVVTAPAPIAVSVISKIELAEPKRRAIARKLEPVSAATAGALLRYTRIPDLF